MGTMLLSPPGVSEIPSLLDCTEACLPPVRMRKERLYAVEAVLRSISVNEAYIAFVN